MKAVSGKHFHAVPPHRTQQLPMRHLGQRVLVFPRLDSTNTLALSLAGDPSQHGVVVLAEEQSAGRGQYGRSWQAPPRTPCEPPNSDSPARS